MTIWVKISRKCHFESKMTIWFEKEISKSLILTSMHPWNVVILKSWQNLQTITMFDQTFLVEKGHVSLRAPYRTDENNFRLQILSKYNFFFTENLKCWFWIRFLHIKMTVTRFNYNFRIIKIENLLRLAATIGSTRAAHKN